MRFMDFCSGIGGGRDTAKMLQFKVNPADLFEI